MTYRQPLTLITTLSLAMTIGCDVPELEGVDAAPSTPAQQTAAVEVEEEPAAEETTAPGEPPVVTSQPREFEAKDSKKGKKSRQAGGYLGAVASARVTSVNRITIAKYKHALDLFWATEGYYPKTHEEFMEKIIKFNQIQLPELEPGVEYIYDPEDHTLKIHRPGAETQAEESEDK